MIRRTFGPTRFDDPDSKISLNPIELVDLMGEGFKPNIKRFGSAFAVDYIEAYYKARTFFQYSGIYMTLTGSPIGCGEQVRRRCERACD